MNSGRHISRTRGLTLSLLTATAIAGYAPAASAIDLATAIRKAVAADPRLAGAEFEIEAAKGGTIQAGKKPNPELSFEVEDFFGTREYEGFNKKVLTVSVQQKFEKGGKLAARVAVARGKEDVADAEIAILTREIVAQTKIDYISVLGTQTRVELLVKSVKRLDELVPLLKRRVEAGASPPADVARGELAVGKARIQAEKARAELVAAKRLLVSNWAGPQTDAMVVAGSLRHNGHKPAALPAILAALDNHPAVRIFAGVATQRQAEVRLQRAMAKPDWTLSAGIKTFNETHDLAFRAGGSVPLQYNDKNQGAIIEAERRQDKVESEQDTALRGLKRRVIEAYGELEANCLEARKLSETAIPIARRASIDVQKGFEQGRLGVKDLLDSNREVNDAEVQQIEADMRCHAAAAKLETISATKPFATGWETVMRSSENEQ